VIRPGQQHRDGAREPPTDVTRRSRVRVGLDRRAIDEIAISLGVLSLDQTNDLADEVGKTESLLVCLTLLRVLDLVAKDTG
jgi:hypothetical protein